MNKEINNPIPVDVLQNKGRKEIAQILGLSFEYLLAGIAQEYFEVSETKNLKEFNEKNPFGWAQLLVNPFFIATSNGHSEALYSLFGEFQSHSFGPASMSIYHLITKDLEDFKDIQFKYFNIRVVTGLPQVEVLNPNLYNSFEKIKYALITDEKIDLGNKEINYGKILIPSDIDKDVSTPLYKTIDKGIEIIKRQAKSNFFTADKKSILFKANYFDAFREEYFDDRVSVIDYNKIKNQIVKPFFETKTEKKLNPV